MICGIPLGAGAMSTNSKYPRERFSEAISLSPWRTWILTTDWLSTTVVKVFCFLIGIVEFMGMIRVKESPLVSIPRERGVTSSRTMSLISPWRMAL
ncbi:MAG: hypothetical protein BWY86_01157 [Candidatus Aminicenantes bacterium ADurb.Bin508]|nr:MAG: hypothetical protein BWY86_01157 [Candidatus Aminicenantes bacterium ADurb.Bin508]